jgi:hypothetical protein
MYLSICAPAAVCSGMSADAQEARNVAMQVVQDEITRNRSIQTPQIRGVKEARVSRKRSADRKDGQEISQKDENVNSYLKQDQSEEEDNDVRKGENVINEDNGIMNDNHRSDDDYKL